MKRFVCQSQGRNAECYDASTPVRAAEDYVGDLYRYRADVPGRVTVTVYDSETRDTKAFNVKTEIVCHCFAIEVPA